jgi:hypothetical protein
MAYLDRDFLLYFWAGSIFIHLTIIRDTIDYKHLHAGETVIQKYRADRGLVNDA